ncbi:hypothetical protein JAAARDRAFT_60086 [Jaapia argillacea MUCL 33604]|uniref:Uncharacterized protein n=1 Tax=Jaapia argillacea MUCL 33604 TaxID=933084 RepID=A0A067PJZ5_9AGAM|nr:hypothetical protein JAAARDRAFT_60086 [Jaapia argillacea MUCL 33604]
MTPPSGANVKDTKGKGRGAGSQKDKDKLKDNEGAKDVQDSKGAKDASKKGKGVNEETQNGAGVGGQAKQDGPPLRERLGEMKTSISSLETAFQGINIQSEGILSIPSPTFNDSMDKVTELRREFRSYDHDYDAQMEKVKVAIKRNTKKKVAELMSAQIQTQIQAAIAEQVRDEVAKQLKDHLPLSPEEQVEESKETLSQLKYSVANSDARRMNSMVQQENLDDDLSLILNLNGTSSPLYPTNLKLLFAYDDDMVKRLLKDYDLPDQRSREANINCFIRHIGSPIRCETL